MTEAFCTFYVKIYSGIIVNRHIKIYLYILYPYILIFTGTLCDLKFLAGFLLLRYVHYKKYHIAFKFFLVEIKIFAKIIYVKSLFP